MTIAEWNLVLNSVMSGLMIGGGIWFKYVVEQQLKSKDTAIQALEGLVKLKDAQIAGLQADTAPAITKAYAEMRQHANSVTEEYQKLSVQVAELSKKRESAQESVEIRELLGEAKGLAEAFGFMQQRFEAFAFSEETTNSGNIVGRKILEAVVKVGEQLNAETRRRMLKAANIIKDSKQLREEE